MAFKIFNKSKKLAVKAKKEKAAPVAAATDTMATDPAGTVEGDIVLKSFYISEKASRLLNLNQYIFLVTKNANKQEIKKQVQARFKVKVTNVKVLNMPEKTRNLGRHSGIRSGFKKAIVTLADGDSIGQVKA